MYTNKQHHNVLRSSYASWVMRDTPYSSRVPGSSKRRTERVGSTTEDAHAAAARDPSHDTEEEGEGEEGFIPQDGRTFHPPEVAAVAARTRIRIYIYLYIFIFLFPFFLLPK